MKFISWNVNGLRAVMQKDFMGAFETLDADVFCLQETKLQEGQIQMDLPGYEQFWNYAEKKGYSGTAVFTRVKPISVTYGMGIEEHDHEGRLITLEFEDFYQVTCYTPNSQDGLQRARCLSTAPTSAWDRQHAAAGSGCHGRRFRDRWQTDLPRRRRLSGR